MLVALVGGPLALAAFSYPWVSVAGAAVAVGVWVYFGPRPMPGFLNGIVAVGGLTLLVTMVLVRIIRAL